MKAGNALTWTAIVLLGGASAGLGFWLARHREIPVAAAIPAGLRVVAPGEPVPDLTLVELRRGEVQRLPAPQGRPRLVNYWASWCGPCREEMPLLDRYAKAQDADGVQVVGIALDSVAEARRFLFEVPVSFALYLETPGPTDSSVMLGNSRGVLPYTVLVDGDGRLLKTHTGPFPDDASLAAWAQPN